MANPGYRRFKALVKATAFIHDSLVSLTAATTATRSANAGRTNLLKAVAGFTVTLPAATGSGNRYRFVVGTSLTSGTYVIKVADATDVFVGGVFINDVGDTTPATADFYPTAATSDTLTMTQSIGGGKLGDWVEFEDIATDTWQVMGAFQNYTDPTTPFSATV